MPDHPQIPPDSEFFYTAGGEDRFLAERLPMLCRAIDDCAPGSVARKIIAAKARCEWINANADFHWIRYAQWKKWEEQDAAPTETE